MNQIVFYSFLSVFVVSLVSFVGVFTLALKANKLEKILVYMISFAAGGLLGDAFIHLLPEMVTESGITLTASLYILCGIGFSFVVEKVIRWRHCHHSISAEHPHPLAFMNLFGDVVHNFIDGLIIGGAFLISIPVGIATTTAVVLHEIPQEIGDFGILLHSGMSKKKALFLNFLISLSAFLGLGIALLLGSYVADITLFLVPFAAGSFIYIAIADLIPEMHKEVAVSRSLIQFLFFLLGIAVMLGILFNEGHEGGHGHSNASEVSGEVLEIY
jgi:zinc and cadmium transporter